jgi:hypothetical protein
MDYKTSGRQLAASLFPLLSSSPGVSRRRRGSPPQSSNGSKRRGHGSVARPLTFTGRLRRYVIDAMWRGMTAMGVRRENAALSSGCKSHPVIAPTGSSRSGYGGNEIAEAFGCRRMHRFAYR